MIHYIILLKDCKKIPAVYYKDISNEKGLVGLETYDMYALE